MGYNSLGTLSPMRHPFILPMRRPHTYYWSRTLGKVFAIASNVMIIKVVQTGWGRHPIVLVEHRLVKQNWFWNGLLVSLGALAKGFSKIAGKGGHDSSC